MRCFVQQKKYNSVSSAPDTFDLQLHASVIVRTFLPLMGYSSSTPPISTASVPTSFRMAMCLRPVSTWHTCRYIRTGTLCHLCAVQLFLIHEPFCWSELTVYYWNHPKPRFWGRRRRVWWWSWESCQKAVSSEVKKPTLNTGERWLYSVRAKCWIPGSDLSGLQPSQQDGPLSEAWEGREGREQLWLPTRPRSTHEWEKRPHRTWSGPADKERDASPLQSHDPVRWKHFHRTFYKGGQVSSDRLEDSNRKLTVETVMNESFSTPLITDILFFFFFLFLSLKSLDKMTETDY